MTWQPSHRREDNGEIRDRFTERHGEDVREVAIVLPEVYAAAHDPAASEVALRMATALSQELLRSVLDVIADGRAESTGMRLAAVRKYLGHDPRSYSEIADDLGISAGNLHRLVKELPARLNGISEGKPSKK